MHIYRRIKKDSIFFETISVALVLAMVSIFLVWSKNTKVNELSMAEGEIKHLGSQFKVQSEVDGRVAKLYVDEGQLVENGQLLLEIDQTSLVSKIGELEAQIRLLKGQRSSIWVEYQSMKNLSDNGLVAKIDFLRVKRRRKEIQDNIHVARVKLKSLRKQGSSYQLFSPVKGHVYELSLSKVNSVIESGEVIMQIVPINSILSAELKIKPSDIGHVKIGLPIVVKFTSYDFSKYGFYETILKDISATTYLDSQKNPYYRAHAEIKINAKGLVEGLGKPILPGMLIQADIKTGEKTIMEYLLKPVFSNLDNALSER